MSEFNPDAQYDTEADLIRAFTDTFKRLEGDPEDWKGYVFRTDENGETIRVRPYTGKDGKGKWSVTLSTTRDDFEVVGTGELTPPRVVGAIRRMRENDARLLRVDKDRVAEALLGKAEAVDKARADLRHATIAAVRVSGLSKVAVADASGISRPTLDAWLAEEEKRWGNPRHQLG